MRALCLAAFVLLIGFDSNASNGSLAEGDLEWSKRAEVLVDDKASPERVLRSIRFYRAALEQDPGSLEARWKQLRSLHYAIDFTSIDPEAQASRIQQATLLARQSIESLETTAGKDEDRARVFFWSAIAWAARAQHVGLLTIVREGVASRIHEYAEESLSLDPSVDQGGAQRLLSRLHATLPRVPFVSGWVDREQSLPMAEAAFAVDPAHPGSRVILALALLERAPEREDEARSLLESVVRDAPRPDFVVEDKAIRKQALEQLEKLRDG